MGGSRTTAAILVTLICALLFTACGVGGGAILDDPIPDQTTADSSAGLIDAGRTSSGFTLGILRDTFLGGDPAGDFTVEESRNGDETVITVSVSGADDLRACYGSLSYDAARYTPVAVDQLPLVAQHDGGEVLTLSDTATPGTVDFGQVLANCDQRNGLTGDAVVARLRFSAGAYTGGRTMSGVPASEEERPYMVLNLNDRRMDWDYYMRGDYNQDGLVGIGDLTPIGRNYGTQNRDSAEAPLAPWDEGTALWIIDGNNDGEIGIQDITVIGQKYGKAVTGYNIYRGTSATDGYPGSATATSPGQPAGFIPFSEIKGGAGGEMRYFRFPAPFLTGDSWYWLRPTDGDSEGIAGNPACFQDAADLEFGLGFHKEVSEPLPDIENARLRYHDDGQLIVDVWVDNPVDLGFTVAELTFDAQRLNPVGTFHGTSLAYPPVPNESRPTDKNEFPGRIDIEVKRCYENDTSETESCQLARVWFAHEAQPSIDELFDQPDYFTPYKALAEYDAGTHEYTWYYCNPGDYNQDGLVSGLDILQLGMRFEATAPGCPNEVFPATCIEYLIDTCMDGMITVADLSGISMNTFNAVTGYNIYYTDDPDYPGFSILDAADWELTGEETLLGHVGLADAVNNRFEERLKFTFTIDDPVPGRCYWAAPELNGSAQYVPGESIIQIPAE